ncbi:MAG: hypothetical protein JWN45_2828 [Acidobacteriaceae bacterium]|nr:hypothetical protein [Acidobacteriaceae bacterium]
MSSCEKVGWQSQESRMLWPETALFLREGHCI